ncbi:MAG: hypothetical protein M1839_000063 [Geoglossum umbratile]|nr:MAG: hypothetical protein M1839_000063 [Geoglossum umbratile]
MSIVVRERDRRIEEEVYRRPSPPRTLRSFRRYRVNRPFDEEEAYDDLYQRERQFERDRHRYGSPYEVESYSRSTEYFSRPQTVVVREEPRTVIVRERRVPIVVPVREPELVEDDSYYERESRDGRRQEIVYRREKDIEPADSASQWSSDDDLVYIHRETTEGGFRDRSPHHGRHLAEGIVAGIGAEEIIRHHRKNEGRPDRHHKRNVAGAALAGAVGAEALSRVRSSSRHRHRRHHHQHHTTSDLAKLGLGTAAVAAAVNYGMNRNRDHRSRSRRRRHSVSGTRVYYDDHDSDDRSRSRSRSRHRGRHLAEAALGTAAAAGLIHHERGKSGHRSYSRSRSRSRSRHGSSRHRSGSPSHHKLPLAAAAAGTAALLAHHENKKREHEGSSRRSRSRSRSVAYSDAGLSSSPRDSGLIEYGDEPVYRNAAGDYSDRRRDTDRVGIPLAAGAGYAAGHAATSPRRERSRSRSRTGRRERSPSYSSSSPSPVGRSQRSRRSSDRHHDHHLAEAALAAGAVGAAGIAAHEIKKNHDRKKAKEPEQRYYDGSPYDERDYPNPPPADYHPSPLRSSPPSSYYPATNTFPPPPTKPYDSADYPPPPAPSVSDHVPPPPIPLPDPHAYGGVERVERIEEGRADSVSDSATHLDSPEPPKSVTFNLQPQHRAHSYSPPPSRHSERDESPSAASDSTIELPPRFDKKGRLMEDRHSGRRRDRYGDPGEEFAFRFGEAVAGLKKMGRIMERGLGRR